MGKDNFAMLMNLDSVGMAEALDEGVKRAIQRGDTSMSRLGKINEMLSLTNDSLTFGKVMSGIITQDTYKGRITGDAVEMALSVAKRVSNDAMFDKLDQLDGIQNVSGTEVLATVLFSNISVIMSSGLGRIIGSISDVEPVKGNRDNIKFKVFSQSSVVIKGMGSVADNVVLNPSNATLPMAFAQRELNAVTETGVTVFTLNAKALSTAVTNTPLARGETEVIIGDNFTLNDFEVRANETTYSATGNLGTGTATLAVNYTAGTVTVTLSAATVVAVGTPIQIVTSLSHADMSAITGTVGVDIIENMYIARTVSLATEASFMNTRTALLTGNVNLFVDGLRVISEKIATERIALSLKKATSFANTASPDTLDVSGITGLSVADKFASVVVKWGTMGKAILTESQVTDKVSIVGGSGLVTIATSLATGSGSSANEAVLKDTEENGYKWIATIGDTFDCFYDPTFDTTYPPVGNVHKMWVIGSPSDPTKRACITGVGLPLMPPTDAIFGNDGKKIIRLEGKLIVDSNKDGKSRKLARMLQVTGV